MPTKISQLAGAVALTGAERVPAVQGGATVSLTGDQLVALMRGRTPPAYFGQVASRCHFARKAFASAKSAMIRTVHRAADDIATLQIMEANWYLTTAFVETGSGADVTVTASVEYPLNSCTRITWDGGAAAGTVANGANKLSDLCAVAIPKGAFFAIRRYISCPAGNIYKPMADLTDHGFGTDVYDFAASGTPTDRTMTSAPVTMTAGGSTGFCHYPAGIFARTRLPSFGIVGDSRSEGYAAAGATTTFNGRGDSGEIARAIGAGGFATLNGGTYGIMAQQFVASHANQVQALSYCSHIVVQAAINDITGGASLAAVQASITTIAGYFPKAQLILATTPPVSTSTDGWATTANQTPHATNGVRVALNAWKRQVPQPFAECWEVADLVESARGSGLWQPGFTGDGIHESAVGYAAIEAGAALGGLIASASR